MSSWANCRSATATPANRPKKTCPSGNATKAKPKSLDHRRAGPRWLVRPSFLKMDFEGARRQVTEDRPSWLVERYSVRNLTLWAGTAKLPLVNQGGKNLPGGLPRSRSFKLATLIVSP